MSALVPRGYVRLTSAHSGMPVLLPAANLFVVAQHDGNTYVHTGMVEYQSELVIESFDRVCALIAAAVGFQGGES